MSEGKTEPGLVYEKMAAALAAMGAVPKSGRAPDTVGGYAFRGIDDVMAALHVVFAAHGLFVTPHVLERDISTYESRGGATMQLVGLLVAFDFYATDGSSVRAVAYGTGADSGDKAAYKAMAGALKYALTQTFCVPTEEVKDAEADDVEGPSAPARAPRTPPARAAAPAPVPVSGGYEPEGLDETIRFGKYKSDGISWRQCGELAAANPDGAHYGWLVWLADQPIEPGKFEVANLARQKMIRWMLARIESADARPGGQIGDPPPPSDEDCPF